jgi:cytochrome b subunit of formate dehydrogenase
MATRRLQRTSRRARLLHAAVYLTALPSILTGWWILASRSGWLGRLFGPLGAPNARVHVWLGWALAGAIVVSLLIGGLRIVGFARETFRLDRGDGRWWLRWPGAVLTGRFARHEGRFDPGQRVANVIMLGGLVVLTVTGIGLAELHGGPVFALLDRIHRLTTFVVTPVILGHLLVALGILPGYRGVWRSMHLGGRVPEATAKRIWPGWTERAAAATERRDGAVPLQDVPAVEPPPSLEGRVVQVLARERRDSLNSGESAPSEGQMEGREAHGC